MKFNRYLIFSVVLAGLLAASSIIVARAGDFINGGTELAAMEFSNYSPLIISASQAEQETGVTKTISRESSAIVSVYSILSGQSQEAAYSRPHNRRFRYHTDAGQISRSQSMGAGTGFFVDSRGYILTNNHVVPADSTGYSVVLTSGTELQATLAYRDPSLDIAILKVADGDYPVLSLGDSSVLRVGQDVYMVGNALGRIQFLMSPGDIIDTDLAITAVDLSGPVKLAGTVETSAQLYPGESGGPTFDASGRVVGINVAMAVDQSHDSYFIPINMAKSAISQTIP